MGEIAPGLFRCLLPSKLEPVDSVAKIKDRPILVLLHGTASRTAASFGGLEELSQQPLWRELRATYGEHIYALEHRTLAQSPIENAIDLVQILPKGARIHLLSHSRGGLVGELIARAQRRDSDAPGGSSAASGMV